MRSAARALSRTGWGAALAFLAASAAASDPNERLPPDFRWPVRVGGGYGSLHESGAFVLGTGFQFLGKPLAHGVHLGFAVGTEAVTASSIPHATVDATGTPVTEDFSRSLLHVGGGLVLQLGAPSEEPIVDPWGPVAFLEVTPGASFSWVPGAKEGEPHGLVGFGLGATLDVHPLYVAPEHGRALNQRGVYGLFLLSSLFAWVTARMDWVESERGALVAGGLGLDMVRVLFLPLFAR